MSVRYRPAWLVAGHVGGLLHIVSGIPGLWAGFTGFDEDPPPVSC